MEKTHLHVTIVLWVFSFTFVSFLHSFVFHLWLSEIPGFYSNLSGFIGIGLILTFASICATFLLFIWMIYIIRKSEKSTTNWIKLNGIPLIIAIIGAFIIHEATASWGEAIIYVGSYLMAFLAVVNFYALRLKRAKINDPEILDQLTE